MKIKETEKILKDDILQLQKIVEEYISFFKDNTDFFKLVKDKYNIQNDFLMELEKQSKDLLTVINNLNSLGGESFFQQIKKILLNDYSVFLGLLKMFFYQIIFYTNKQNIVDLISSSDDPAFNFIGGNYLLLTMNFKKIKNLINQFFFKDITLKDELVVDDTTDLWDVSDMQHKIFPSDFYKIREFTNIVTEGIEGVLSEDDLTVLQQQVSELIKNAIKHGNHNDVNKIIKVWYEFNNDYYKVIVEDQGDGFQNLEKWNEFNRKRNEAIVNQDMEKIVQYAAYRNENSDDTDGGNALFAALEYWDSGLIYNKKRNKVLAVKYFFK